MDKFIELEVTPGEVQFFNTRHITRILPIEEEGGCRVYFTQNSGLNPIYLSENYKEFKERLWCTSEQM